MESLQALVGFKFEACGGLLCAGPREVLMEICFRDSWSSVRGSSRGGMGRCSCLLYFPIESTGRDAGGPRAGDAEGPRAWDAGGPRPGDAGGPQPADAGGPRAGDAGGPRAGDAGGPRAGDAGGPRAGDAGGPQPADAGGPSPGPQLGQSRGSLHLRPIGSACSCLRPGPDLCSRRCCNPALRHAGPKTWRPKVPYPVTDSLSPTRPGGVLKNYFPV